MPRSQQLSERMRTEGRARILGAAGHLFARLGFDGCLVADIAREAGMSQGNVYWYFTSKDDILKAVLVSAFESLDDLFQRAVHVGGGGRERLMGVIDEYIALGRTGGGADATVVVYGLMRSGPGRLTELGFDAAGLVGGYVTSLAAILRDAKEEGALSQDADPATLAVHFFSYFNGISITLGDAVMTFPEEELRQAVLRLLGVHMRGETR